MKRIIMMMALTAAWLSALAVPAKRGAWRTATTAEGEQVVVRLVGDEALHYFVGADGATYIETADGTMAAVDLSELKQRASARRARTARRQRDERRRRVGGTGNTHTGQRKGIIILAAFADKAFETNHDNAFYQRVANERGLQTDDGFVGSVSDYFSDQSDGQFELTFDVVGPIVLQGAYSYYGANVWGEDARAGEMVAEACMAVDDVVDFADYDWDGDGEVEQVFVLYAGLGEAAGGDRNTIWPHMWDLQSSDYGSRLTTDGVDVNVYACSSELTVDYDDEAQPVRVDGIGTFCHEFSHCLGLPDVYDTAGSNFGMATWDIMDYGNYNGGGFVPSGYTAYEKWVAGWIEPVELTNDAQIDNLKPTAQGGNAYVVYNDSHPDEFFIVENRARWGWDSAQYGEGLIVMHVDYDEAVWAANTVNNSAARQRCTIVHADNSDGFIDAAGNILADELAGDAYPYESNNGLGSASTPRWTLYNANSDGTFVMNKELSNIHRNADGTVAFVFKTSVESSADDAVFFHETFDRCSGTGGNDGIWSGNVASSTLIPDNDGWTSKNMFGGLRCMRIGNSSNAGIVYSPTITTTDEALLTVVAAPWGNDGNSLDIYFGDINLGTYAFEAGKWTTVTLPIGVTGTDRLSFVASKRFFIDDVKVHLPETNGIEQTIADKLQPADGRIYSIDGRLLGTDIDKLGRGLYIVGGKKIVR